MQTKYEKYEQLGTETLQGLMRNQETWTSFLATSSRMYKYTFDEQVLIHAQRPDTRACADFAFWTTRDRMNRHLKARKRNHLSSGAYVHIIKRTLLLPCSCANAVLSNSIRES